jgi:predicted RND superfamily exporter protein
MNCQPFLTWLLSRGRRPALGLLLLLTLFLAVFAARVRVEADTRSMVSRQADRLAAYDRFLDRFGNDEDLLLSVRMRIVHRRSLVREEGVYR